MQEKLLSQNFYLKTLNKLNTCAHTDTGPDDGLISQTRTCSHIIYCILIRHLKHPSIADRIR